LHNTPIARPLGIALMLLIACVMGANHIAARIAFDHGVNITTAVTMRSGGTALAVLALLLAYRVPLSMPAVSLRRTIGIGALLALQSYCLYSAVARIPVVLALLALNIYPMLLTLITWIAGGPRPTTMTLGAMVVALFGLSLALDVTGRSGDIAGRWQEIGVGVSYALTAALSFSIAMFLSGRWLKEVDGRLRSCLAMATVALIIGTGGVIGGSLAAPTDGAGWLGLSLLTLFYGSGITAMFVILPRIAITSDTGALSFEPIAALFMGWFLLGQGLSLLQCLGAMIVVGAIVVLGTAKNGKPK
jgi:drug/metabolite transporter (DMT)-like permease